ncbi:hypothetical protein ES703_44717 [subsurface metagenome]
MINPFAQTLFGEIISFIPSRGENISVAHDAGDKPRPREQEDISGLNCSNNIRYTAQDESACHPEVQECGID